MTQSKNETFSANTEFPTDLQYQLFFTRSGKFAGVTFREDCFHVLPYLNQVQFVFADLPYGITACSWDSVIDLNKLWQHLSHCIQPNAVLCFTATQPFTSVLGVSKIEWLKYEWVWDKIKPNGFQHAPNRPMQRHESVLVFSPAPMGHVSQLGDRRMSYNPQGVTNAGKKTVAASCHSNQLGARPKQVGREYIAKTGYPHSIQTFSRDVDKQHPTQKPVALVEYLINTYTNPGDIVLDPVMGSGTTCVACINTGRIFIGIEKDTGKHGATLGYYDISTRRIEQCLLSKT